MWYYYDTTGCGAAHTAWQIAISECQRQAIYADPKWNNGDVNMKWVVVCVLLLTVFCLLIAAPILHTHSDLPLAGLSVARQIAMVSYRTAKGYHGKFGRAKDASGVFKARSYLAYQVRSTSALFFPSLRSLSFSSSSPHCLSSSFLSSFISSTTLSFSPPSLIFAFHWPNLLTWLQ